MNKVRGVRMKGSFKQFQDEEEFYKKQQLDQYLEDTRKNIEIVHYSFLPQSRSHFKQHTLDVYYDESLTKTPAVKSRGVSRRGTQVVPPVVPKYTDDERADMEREVALLSIQLSENPSRRSSRKTVRSRSSRKADGVDMGGRNNTAASSFSAAPPSASEQVPTGEKLNARLNARKVERGQKGEGWRLPSNKDLTGIWGSRRLYLQKLTSKMDRSLESRSQGIRQGIASAPPQYFARENTFSTMTGRDHPPATAATRPMTQKHTAPPTRGKLIILRDHALERTTPYATKLTLEDIALPTSEHRKGRNKRVRYQLNAYGQSNPFIGHLTGPETSSPRASHMIAT